MHTPSTPRILGLVVSDPVRTRGMFLHGEPLAASAMAALSGWCEAVLVGAGGTESSTPLEQACATADLIVVHDPLCPLLAPAALRSCAAALRSGEAVVGIRPVTDSLKEIADGWVSSTVERDTMAVLASPVVFAADVVAPLARVLPTVGELADLVAVVGALGALCRLRSVTVPSAGRRIADADDLAVLAAVSHPGAES